MAHIMTCLNIAYTRMLSCHELKKINKINCTTYCYKNMTICTFALRSTRGTIKQKEASTAEDSHRLKYLSCKMSHSGQP